MMEKNQLLDWIEVMQNLSTMQTREVPLEDVGEPWGMNESGNYGRKDGKFFDVRGVEVTMAGREVQKWNQPMLVETGPDGVVALVQSAISKRVLVTAKAEPGNKSAGKILLAPSYHASSANFHQAHGGTKPPLVEILEMDGVKTTSQAKQPQDGSRYYQKDVDVRVVEVSEERDLDHLIGIHQTWGTVKDVQDAVRKGFANPHLRDALLLLLTQKS